MTQAADNFYEPTSEQMELENLINRAVRLEEDIKAAQAELKPLKERLTALATFKPGSKTGHLSSINWTVKVQCRDNITWDQGMLKDLVRPALGEGKFWEIFKFKVEPNTKSLNGFLEHGDRAQAELIESARTIKDGAPQVTFEPLEV